VKKMLVILIVLLILIPILIVAAISAPSQDELVLTYLKRKYGRRWNTLDDAINSKPTVTSVLAEVSKATGRCFSSMGDLQVALAPDVVAVNRHFKGQRCDTSDITLETCLDKYSNGDTELILLVETHFGVLVDSVDDIPEALEARFSMDLVKWARNYLPTATALSIKTRGDIPAAIAHRFNELTVWADVQFGVKHQTVTAVVGSMDAYIQKPYRWARARNFDIGVSPRIETVLEAVGVRLDGGADIRHSVYKAVDALKTQLVLLGTPDPVPDASLTELIEALRAQVAAIGVGDDTESVTVYIQRLAAENARAIEALNALLGKNGIGPDASLTELITQITMVVISNNDNKLVEMGVTIAALKAQLALDGKNTAVIIAELKTQLLLLGTGELGVNASLADLVVALRAQVVAMGVSDDTESATVYLQRLVAGNTHTIVTLKAQLVLLGVSNPNPDTSLIELVEAMSSHILAMGNNTAVVSELRAQLALLGVGALGVDVSLAVLVEAMRAHIVAMGVREGTESVTAYIQGLEAENAQNVSALLTQLALLGVGGLNKNASLAELVEALRVRIAAMDTNEAAVVGVLRDQLALLGAGGLGVGASLTDLVEALRAQLVEYIRGLGVQVADVADLARLIGAGPGASLTDTKVKLITYLEGHDSLGEYLDSLRKIELEVIAAIKSHLRLDDDTTVVDLIAHLDKWMTDKGVVDELVNQLLVDNRSLDHVHSQLSRLFVGGSVAHLETVVDAVVALFGRCDSATSFIAELKTTESWVNPRVSNWTQRITESGSNNPFPCAQAFWVINPDTLPLWVEMASIRSIDIPIITSECQVTFTLLVDVGAPMWVEMRTTFAEAGTHTLTIEFEKNIENCRPFFNRRIEGGFRVMAMIEGDASFAESGVVNGEDGWIVDGTSRAAVIIHLSAQANNGLPTPVGIGAVDQR
jgi:hypothetical protein